MGFTRIGRGFGRMVASGCIMAAGAVAQAPEARPPADYVVHEWGTFTSMVGQAGIGLEGLQREEEALPPFVHDLLRIDEFAADATKLPASRVTQKMETPVIYFHTDEPRRVRVSVGYDDGLMTQFFPLPNRVWPLLEVARQQRVDMSKIDGSRLTWDVDLIPRSMPAPAEIPAVDANHPWAWARQVDAAYVRTCCEGTPARPEAEHYIFYRGLGRAQPDVAVRSLGKGALEVRNGLVGAIPFLVVLEMDECGGRFVSSHGAQPGATQRFDLGSVAFDPARESVSRRLGALVQQALEASGLFQDEARAMVATWSRSWFQSTGTRVVYVLPRQQVDRMLPLHLEPPPKDLVRTLVGRIECITPEAQQQVEQALRDRDAEDDSVRLRANIELQQLDRFLEPHLRNVALHGSDPGVRQLAARLLANEVP